MPMPRSPANRAATHGFLRRWLGPLLLGAAVTAAGAPHSGAQAEDSILTWIVKSISSDEDGDIIQASAMQVPQVGTALATGQRISTTAGQHIVLVNGRDLVEVSPNTTITIGDDDSTTTDANVDLFTGTIHVEVGKRGPGQAFSIGAPYLVAIVKGTRFDVSTSNEASAVSVTEGIVAVSAVATGESIDVTAGNTAIVSRRTVGAPALAPTPAGGASSTIGFDSNLESADANTGGSAGESNSGSSSSGDSGSHSDVGGAVGDAADSVGGAVGDAAGAVGGAVNDATGAVGDAVGGAVGGVGGALGGALGGGSNR